MTRTITKFTQNAGVANIDGITVTSAQAVDTALCTMMGDNNGVFTDLFVDGAARVIYNSVTTLPSVRVYGGNLDFSQDARAKTYTECIVRRPGLVNQGYGQVKQRLPNVCAVWNRMI